MTKNGTIVGAPWADAQYAYLSMAVDEESGDRIEYIGRVPLTEDLAAFGFDGKTWADLDAADHEQALLTGVKAARDAQQGATVALPAVKGSVAL